MPARPASATPPRRETEGLASRAAATAEIAAFVGLLLSFIWGWQRGFPGSGALVVALYFGIGLETHLRRGESMREIGFRLDNLLPALRPALAWSAGAWVVALATGAALGGWAFPPAGELLVQAPWRLLWATAQQYGLLCVLYRRLREVLPGRRAPMVAGGIAFALFHLPNPFLAAVALLAGMLACYLYERETNVYALAVAHALISLVLGYALPQWLTLQLKVGPQGPADAAALDVS